MCSSRAEHWLVPSDQGDMIQAAVDALAVSYITGNLDV
jgi:hypothetical protein